MKLILIAALASNRVIGKDNALLWHLPQDMRYFKAQTLGHPVIMGRKTWDSLPERFRPLPGRRNIVLTRNAQWQAAGAEVVASLPAALALVGAAEQAFVIGGAQIYAATLPLADELLLTEIDRPFDGDATFPEVNPHMFTEVSREPHCAAAPNTFNFAFVRYQRRT